MPSHTADNEELQAGPRFYTGAYITALAGIAAISAAVESSGFLLTAALLLTTGHYVSVKLRKQGRNLRMVETVVIGICLATYARLFATGDSIPLLNPGNAAYHKELSLAVMLVWAEVVRSFSLVSDEALLFSAVPSLALIGVVATTSPGPDILLYFTIWVCSSTLMFMESGRTPGRDKPGATARSASVAGAVGISSVLVGILVSPLLYQAGTWTFLRVAPDLYATRHLNELAVGPVESNTLQISEGPVRLSDRIEMRVACEPQVDAMWRAKVWDRYTRRGWKSSSVEEAVMGSGLFGVQMYDSPYADATDAGETVVQQFTLAAGLQGPVYAAAEPESISIDIRALRVDNFNCWRLPARPMPAITQYTVWSRVVAPTGQLRSSPQDYDVDAFEQYLHVPLETQRGVQPIVDRIVAGKKNAYEKIIAMQRYLATECVYDLETPPMPARERDAVTYFLTKSKRGYCDVFASALAIMARTAGIPSRIATGYASGEYDPQTEQYIVRDKDRHSWAEIYFPGFGWVQFEATPDAGMEAPGFWRSLWVEMKSLAFGENARLLLLLAGLLGALATLRMVTFTGEEAYIRRLPDRPERRRAKAIWKKLAKALRPLGVRSGRAATTGEMMKDALRALPEDALAAREGVEVTTDLIARILFSGDDDLSAPAEDLEAAWNITRRELRAARRRMKELQAFTSKTL